MRSHVLQMHLAILLTLLSFLSTVPDSMMSLPVQGTALNQNTQITKYNELTYTYRIFLPLINKSNNSVPEVDTPGCRWSHTIGYYLVVYYKWGAQLQSPGSSWRVAFESGMNDWFITGILPYYLYNGNSQNSFNTYNQPSQNRGIT